MVEYGWKNLSTKKYSLTAREAYRPRRSESNPCPGPVRGKEVPPGPIRVSPPPLDKHKLKTIPSRTLHMWTVIN